VDWLKLLSDKAISILLLIVAVVSALVARRSARSARRSADAAEAAHEAQVRPHVIAEVATHRYMVGGQERERLDIMLVNHGNGLAQDVSAEIWMSHNETDTQLPLQVRSALGRGERSVVPGIPDRGAVEIWDEIAFRDIEGRRYRSSKSKQDQIWSVVEEGEAE